MPIYEYKRPDGTTFELQQSFSDKPLKKDPDTGVPVERVLHAPAVHFKGKGFYNTDYGTRRRQRETAAASSSEGSASSEGSGSSEGSASSDGAASSASKPDKKAEPKAAESKASSSSDSSSSG